MAEPNNFRDLSSILSRVLDDIGINEECINSQRELWLLSENINTFDQKRSHRLEQCYIFGSRTEGTTTPDLHSDIDMLMFGKIINVFQEIENWISGRTNMRMIESEYPGYCTLQCLRDDKPLPVLYQSNHGHDAYYEQGRLCLKSDFIHADIKPPNVRNGPAKTIRNPANTMDIDRVIALRCKTWPKRFKRMSLFKRPGKWPTPEMVRYIENSGCFIVGKGHRLSEKRGVEWRISTSLAERCLMFSLNITQIRCCILLKMIFKTFIEPRVPGVVSSYICKTLLFHCIERTDTDFWTERNLLPCLSRVLLYMLAALRSMNCPNYFNQSDNLLLGKIDGVKQKKLVHILRTILQSNGRFVLQINFDNVKKRLADYITDRCSMQSWDDNEKVRNGFFITCLHVLVYRVANMVLFDDTHTALEDRTHILRTVLKYTRKFGIESEMAAIVFPFLCSFLASLEANKSILRGRDLTPNTLLLFKSSLNSDVTSSRLKYASYLYCTGQFKGSLTVLEDVEQRISGNVIPLCPCYLREFVADKRRIANRERQRCLSTRNIALCVTFGQAEIQCCPLELRFEMFRSTEQDMTYRHDKWMYKAAIDPIPYIYFLQYMVHRRLGDETKKNRALFNLSKLVFEDYLLLGHRETVFNLLGQCMEQETMYDIALKCYVSSLTVRPRNNAAKWHIGRLLYALVNAKLVGCYLQ